MIKRLICTLLFTILVFLMTSCVLPRELPDGETEQSSSQAEESNVISYKNGMRLFVVTDLHYHHNDADSDEAKTNQYGYTATERMERLVADILGEHRISKLDGVLVLGDLGGNNYTIRPYMKSENTEVDASYYGSDGDTIFKLDELYLSRLREAGIPVYCLPGNHDTYSSEMWEQLFGYKKDHLIELPEYDTAILMLDLYGLEPTNQFFVNGRETLSIRTSRTAEEKRTLDDIFARARDYGHVIVCTHQNAYDADLKPYLETLDNIDVFLSGDGHRVRDLGTVAQTGANAYMMGVYSYSIAEEAKVQNGFGVPHLFCTPEGEIAEELPWKIDMRAPEYTDYSFREATAEETADTELQKKLVYLVSPEEALRYFRWNYSILESTKEGEALRATAVYPKTTYYGISKTTGHLLRPHYAMFPSVNGEWHQPYKEELLFTLQHTK